MNLAVIKNGKVINTVLVPDTWSGAEGEWQIPHDCSVVPSNEASIDDDWDDVQITNNRGPKVESPNPERQLLEDKANILLAATNIRSEIKEFVRALVKRVN